MEVICTKHGIREQVGAWRAQGLTVGLVPTMGYLHEGHQSLITAARQACDRVVVSVFVNPTQFGPGEDYASYPRDLGHDAAVARACGASVIFHPAAEEMYPEGYGTYVEVERLGDGLCGARRPVHFRGVCTVVTKLLNIVQPDQAFFGQKDAQQLAIVKRLVRDLDLPVTVVGCPIVREEDGLAKSSRNTYLSPGERAAAPVLFRALGAAQALIDAGERDAAVLRERMGEVIAGEPLARVDYIEVVDALELQPVARLDAPVLIALAVYVGTTRLIDNLTWEA